MDTKQPIREHMEVIACCGTHVGEVDSVQGESIKLTKRDVSAAGKHHFIPCDWVDHVDQHVHLKKDSQEVFANWKTENAVASA